MIANVIGLEHPSFQNLALEADGVALGRARVQLFRAASIRLMQGMQLHFGPQTEMTPDPPTGTSTAGAATGCGIGSAAFFSDLPSNV